MDDNFLIDTHTHLDFDRFDNDRKDVISRAKENNVKAMLAIGIDLKSSLRALKIAEEYENIFASVGVHPHDANAMTNDDFEHIAALLDHPKVVAIGEVGLDYHYNYSPQDVQRRVFRQFLDLSLERQLPIIIHTREADEDILALIQEKARSGWRGVFHCFSGDEKMAKRVLELGFHVSFTGTVTFKNSNSIQVAKQIPLNRLMIETDCPFMAPMPHRGKRNEPAFVHYVARQIAEAQGISFQEIAISTTQNAVELFRLKLVHEELSA